jgi:hypothetical protein
MILLAMPVLFWAVWAFLTRGGFAFGMLGISLVRSDGRPASRLQCAARALLVWVPVTLLLLLSAYLDSWYLSALDAADQYQWLPWLSWAAAWSAVLLLLSFVALPLRSPVQSLHDRLVGTYLVPR